MASVDVDSIEQEALDFTRELCRKPSISAEGRALEETAELVETLLTASGVETKQVTVDGAPPAAYGERGGRRGGGARRVRRDAPARVGVRDEAAHGRWRAAGRLRRARR